MGGLGGANEEAIYNYFKSFGEIEDYYLQRDYQTGITKSYAFIVFKNKLVNGNFILFIRSNDNSRIG